MENFVKANDYFEFCGIKYKAVEVGRNSASPFAKCSLCSLNKDGRKLCLSHACKCGSCAGWARKDNTDVIFVCEKIATEDAFKKLLSLRKELTKMENLKHENERLKVQISRIGEDNRKLREQNTKFHEQLKTIYANINKAIKTEVYKFMTK
jgi:hypothetical protein